MISASIEYLIEHLSNLNKISGPVLCSTVLRFICIDFFLSLLKNFKVQNKRLHGNDAKHILVLFYTHFYYFVQKLKKQLILIQ